MSTDLHAAFRGQGRSCAMLGSPFMGRLMPLIADRLAPTNPVARRLLDWPGDVGSSGQSVPLRLAGTLHGLVLDGADAPLAAAYPPHSVDDDTLWSAIDGALTRHETRVMAWLDKAPQTNEVRRSAALIPSIWWALAQVGRPLVLSELGASAGLNLSLDQFSLCVDGQRHGPVDSPVRLSPQWRGSARPHPMAIHVADRAGVDLNPLDPGNAADAQRLRAYLWPDQNARRVLTDGAIGLAKGPPDAGDAAPWLAARLSGDWAGQMHVVYHTVAWQYFPPDTQAACTAALDQAAARATPDAPLLHIAMEADGDAKGAGVTATLYGLDGGARRHRARADFHGRWVDWGNSDCAGPAT